MLSRRRRGPDPYLFDRENLTALHEAVPVIAVLQHAGFSARLFDNKCAAQQA